MKKIEIKNFNKSFGETLVFDNFSIVFDNEINIIMGPSGCGKSTLLNAIAGLVDYSGLIEIDGIAHQNKCDILVSYVFQSHRLIPQKTVFQNLDFALSSAIKDKKIRRERIVAMLGDIGLSQAINFYPHALSGGMAQRAALARAFLFPSDILLMDEPFKGLDADTKETAIDIFFKLWQKDKRTTIFVTHDKNEVDKFNGVVYNFPNKPIEGVIAAAFDE